MSEKFLNINNIKFLEKELQEKINRISMQKLFITEEKLKSHLTENEILELISKGVIEDKSLK